MIDNKKALFTDGIWIRMQLGFAFIYIKDMHIVQKKS